MKNYLIDDKYIDFEDSSNDDYCDKPLVSFVPYGGGSNISHRDSHSLYVNKYSVEGYFS